MYKLTGVRVDVGQDIIGGPFVDHCSEEVVAFFDDFKDANNYIKKSKLKHRKRQSYASDIVFRRNSLLRPYESAYIKECFDEEKIPINPTI